jgi:2-dehydro-3-deoxyphosphogluconate aldolase/(4S)-4-hydroxy-2-oxoglutarate aldolase
MMVSILAKASVIPVLVIERLEDAVPLAAALVAGGLPVLEVTRRTPCCFDAVASIRRHVDGALVGVGSVLAEHHLILAREAGAQFAVSPGMSADLISTAQRIDMPYLPGVATPSEVMTALAENVEMLKFFPAEANGGTAALAALYGPFPGVRFCPTGGVTADNMGDYLALDNVVCVGGSWIAPQNLIAAGDWTAISDLARTATGLAENDATAEARVAGRRMQFVRRRLEFACSLAL